MSRGRTEVPGEPLRWRKSRASNPRGECVEMAAVTGGGVAVRNSREPAEGTLVFTRGEVRAWVEGIKDGEFDDLFA